MKIEKHDWACVCTKEILKLFVSYFSFDLESVHNLRNNEVVFQGYLEYLSGKEQHCCQ